MTNWDLLTINPSENSIAFVSTDPSEVEHFAQILVNRYGAKIALSSRLHQTKYVAVFSMLGKWFDDISKQDRPYYLDVVYSFIVEARERGWRPHHDTTSFIREQ